MDPQIITKLVQIQNQFRFLHWQTTSYSKHKAYGKIYDSFNDLVDDFTEGMMGKYGRPVFTPEFVIAFQDISSISLQKFIDGSCEFLINLGEELDPKVDTDLINLKDEMLLQLNKLKYLLTLK
jgi:hypothetical protein